MPLMGGNPTDSEDNDGLQQSPAAITDCLFTVHLIRLKTELQPFRNGSYSRKSDLHEHARMMERR